MLRPPLMMRSLERPHSVMYPSFSRNPRSPVRNQPSAQKDAAVLSGCSSPPTTAGEPTETTNPPGQDVRDQLAGHAAAAKDQRYVATYSLAKEGRPDRTVTVAVAADGSWVVAIPGGLLGGLVNAAIFRSRDGLFQCSLGPAGGTPAWLDPALVAPGCVKVSRLRASFLQATCAPAVTVLSMSW